MTLCERFVGDVVVVFSALPTSLDDVTGDTLVASASRLEDPMVTAARIDLLVLSVDDDIAVAQVRRRISEGDKPGAVALVGNGPVTDLAEEFQAHVPTFDLALELTTHPVTAYWFMRRPHPSLDALIGSLALRSEAAASVRFIGRAMALEETVTLVPAWPDGLRTQVDPGYDEAYLSEVAASSRLRWTDVAPGPFSALPMVEINGCMALACTSARNRAEPAIVLAEQLRQNSGLTTVVLAGPHADRAALFDSGLPVVGVPELRHDGQGSWSRLWAAMFTASDRVLWLSDTLAVHADLGAYIEKGDPVFAANFREGLPPVPAGAFFSITPTEQLRPYIHRRFGTTAAGRHGVGIVLGQLFPDWRALPESTIRFDHESRQAPLTKFGKVKPWNLGRARRRNPADQIWFAAAAAAGVTGERVPRRLLSTAAAQWRRGKRRSALEIVMTSRPLGWGQIAREVARHAQEVVSRRTRTP